MFGAVCRNYVLFGMNVPTFWSYIRDRAFFIDVLFRVTSQSLVDFFLTLFRGGILCTLAGGVGAKLP